MPLIHQNINSGLPHKIYQSELEKVFFTKLKHFSYAKKLVTKFY